MPNNSELDPSLVAYYRAMDPWAKIIHMYGFYLAGLLGSAAITSYSMPGVDDITISPSKMNYLFDEASGKASGLTDLGYTPSSLQDNLFSIGDTIQPSDFEKVTEWGNVYQKSVEVVGPAGVAGRLITIWQIDHGSTILRFITAWAQVFK